MRPILLLIIIIHFTIVSAFAEKRVLHVGISTGYPPYYYFDEQHMPAGICIDILNSMAERLDITVKYESFPWKRMLHNGKEGIVDAVMPLFITDERKEFLYFPTAPLANEDNSFFTLKDSPLMFKGNLQSITQYHIGVIDTYSYGKKFDTLNLTLKTVAESETQLIQLVLNQRVEMAIGNSKVITYLLNKKNIAKRIKFLSPALSENPLYIGFSQKRISPDFVKKFSKELQEFKTTESYDRILNHYSKQ